MAKGGYTIFSDGGGKKRKKATSKPRKNTMPYGSPEYEAHMEERARERRRRKFIGYTRKDKPDTSGRMGTKGGSHTGTRGGKYSI